jgi:dTDP-4-dehydrorhamnose reductase
VVDEGRKPRILVTGAGGLLGWTLCRTIADSWETYGTLHRHSVLIPGVRLSRTDLTDYHALKELFAAAVSA